MSIELVMPSNHLIFCCPLLLLASIFCSIWVFSSESALCIRWPKNWNFSFSISPSNEYSGLISFRLSGLISLQSNGLSSLLQQHNLNASILWCSASYRVQISHLYMIIGKIIALIIQTFVGKVMSLLFNMLSRFITAFLSRSKCLHGCSHYSQFLLNVLVLWLRRLWDLSSLTRAQTCTPCIGRQSLNHWTDRAVPSQDFCCEKISTAWSTPQCLPKDATLWIVVDLSVHTCL